MTTLDEAARRVRTLYPVLSEAEARQVAGWEHEFPAWHIWPRLGYPDVPGWYARRTMTSPPALLRIPELSGVGPAIDAWIERSAGSWPRAGRASR